MGGKNNGGRRSEFETIGTRFGSKKDLGAKADWKQKIQKQKQILKTGLSKKRLKPNQNLRQN
jgi:hypothetical protein